MDTPFADIKAQHDKFVNDQVDSDARIESGQQLLLRIRAAGSYLVDHLEREQCAQLARNLGEELFKLTGNYFPVRLVPLDVNLISKDISSEHISSSRNTIVPFLAPPRPPFSLKGREDQLHNLRELLIDESNGGGTHALHGLPGIGKTAIAIEIAHDSRVRAHFSDGVLWAGLGHNEVDVRTELGVWGRALGVSISQVSELPIESIMKALQASIGTRRMLFVIDDAWRVEEAQAFLVGGPNCAHLITTRLSEVALQLAGIGTLPIEELKPDDGLDLLNSLAPRAVSLELEEAKRLVEVVGGLPLSLILMGRYLQIESYSNQPRRISEAINLLSDVEKRLDLAQPQTTSMRISTLSLNAPASLRASIKISVDRLDIAARHVLFALTLFPPKPNSFSEQAAISVTGESSYVLDQLTNSGLLESRGDEYYTLHQTIADYGRTKLKEMKEFENTVKERMVKFYAPRIMEYSTGSIDLATQERDTDNIEMSLQLAYELKMYEELINGLHWIWVLERQENYKKAIDLLKQIQEVAKAKDDQQRLAITLYRLGRIEGKLGNYEQSEKYLLEGITLARKINDKKLVMNSLRILGSITCRQDDYQRAEKYIRDGLDLANEIEDRKGKSALLGTLGSIIRKSGNYQDAEAYLQEGLDLAREIGNRKRISDLLNNIGSLRFELGYYNDARKHWTEGLELAREISVQHAISIFESNLGLVESSFGVQNTAEDYLGEVLARTRKNGSKEGNCYSATNLGGVRLVHKDYDEAEHLYSEGLRLAAELGDRDMMSYILSELGKVKIFQHDYEQAEQYLNEGLALADDLKSERLSSILHNVWGEFYLSKKEEDVAHEKFEYALRIAEKLGLQRQIGEALYGLGRSIVIKGEISEAKKLGKRCLTIFKEIGYYKADDVSEWLSKITSRNKTEK